MKKTAIAAVAAAFTLAACAATTTAPPRQAGVPGPKTVSAQRPKPKCEDLRAKRVFQGGGGYNQTVGNWTYQFLSKITGKCQ